MDTKVVKMNEKKINGAEDSANQDIKRNQENSLSPFAFLICLFFPFLRPHLSD